MIEVHVRIAHLEDKLVRLGVGHMGDHVCQERVGGDVEGDAEAEVARALIHQAGEFGSVGRARGGEGDEELAEHVAGGEGHEGDVWVGQRKIERGSVNMGEEIEGGE